MTFTTQMRKDLTDFSVFLKTQLDKNPASGKREIAARHLLAIETILKLENDVRYAFDAEGAELQEVSFNGIREGVRGLVAYAEGSMMHRTDKMLKVLQDTLSDCLDVIHEKSTQEIDALRRVNEALATLKTFRENESRYLQQPGKQPP